MQLRLTYFGSFLCATALLLTAALAPLSAQAEDGGENAQEDISDSSLLSSSGLPIPRFISLKFEEVNLRTGPGTRYPIRWVYKRKHMPVEVIEEFGQWRKLKDVQGDEGWVHQSQLSGARTAVFKQETTLQRYPEDTAPPMIKVGKHVVAQVLECDVEWCEVQVESYKAWTKKASIWGVYPREIM